MFKENLRNVGILKKIRYKIKLTFGVKKIFNVALEFHYKGINILCINFHDIIIFILTMLYFVAF